MKARRLLNLFWFIPFSVFAQSQVSDLGPGPIKGLPGPNSGVQVMPISEMYIPDALKRQALSDFEVQQKKGYIERQTIRSNPLWKIQHGIKVFVDVKDSNPYSSRLEKNLSQVKLAFHYQGIPSIKPENRIGFVGGGGMKSKGWTGVDEYFRDQSLGTCVFRLNKQNGTFIPQEIVRYDIDRKPTTIMIEGNQKEGFLYRILWSDKKFNYDLECVNPCFDLDVKKYLIKFAQFIDRSVNKH